jgi:hypothetical protein
MMPNRIGATLLLLPEVCEFDPFARGPENFIRKKISAAVAKRA